MNHFAEIDTITNVVMRVIVCDTQEWCEKNLGGTWVKTYNNIENKNYAGIGYIYYPEYQNFSPPKPYSSWILNSNLNWESPIPYPNDGRNYKWDENTNTWIEKCCNSCYNGNNCETNL